MAKRKLVTELSDAEILRVARMAVNPGSANAFAESSLDTQLSVERGVIWLIHFIEFITTEHQDPSAVAAGGEDKIELQITRESKSAILAGNDSDLIQYWKWAINRSAAIGTDAGPLWFQKEWVKRYDYPMPLPYASQSIYFSCDTAGLSDTTQHYCRIGYSIREVSDQFFFRVAQALLG